MLLRLLIKILMSPGRKEGINTCITNVVLELLYICVHWYMPNITYFNLFTFRLLQRLLDCVIWGGHTWRAFSCSAPRPALWEAGLWWGTRSWWYYFELGPVWVFEKSLLSLRYALSTSHEPNLSCACTGSVGKGRRKSSKVFLSSVKKQRLSKPP